MKTIEQKRSVAQAAKRPAKSVQNKNEELKTDPPISEKDEVKKAEQTMREKAGK